MNSVFGHCRDSFWTVQFNLEVFVNLGVGSVEHTVQVLEFTVWIWTSWLNE